MQAKTHLRTHIRVEVFMINFLDELKNLIEQYKVFKEKKDSDEPLEVMSNPHTKAQRGRDINHEPNEPYLRYPRSWRWGDVHEL